MNITAEPLEQEPLPDLADETITRIESDLFAGIDAERTAARTKSTRRRRVTWSAIGAAAAVVVVAAVLAPSITGLVSGAGGTVADSASAPLQPERGVAGSPLGSGAETDTGLGAADGAASPSTTREVIATASATVLVPDASAAAKAVGEAAVARGGYVESMTIAGSDVFSSAPQETSGLVAPDVMPYPVSSDWITVRVPADQLTATIADLSELGDVQASAINRQDVTDQTVDLRARIDAAQASVDRLTQLMSQAGSIADLIAAEQALSERQATLESYQQQLAYYESQVSLSSLTVSLTEPAEIVKADPAGFGDGLAAGWNGLVASLNGIVVAIGFLLPWLAVAGVAALVVWGIRRLVRRRRTPAPPAPHAE